MNIFDRLQRNLFTPTQPEELSDAQAKKRVEATGLRVGERVDGFARRYLKPETYERYRSSLRDLRYNITDLPSRVITFFNMFTGGIKRIVEGALAAYDERENKILSNRYVANNPENDQLEPAIAHERVHHATRNFLRNYFEKLGEKARPIVEGFTELITRGLGYDSGAYQEFVYAAYQTLKRMGGDIRYNLYRVLNLEEDPISVLKAFYNSLNQIQRQPVLQLVYSRR